MASCSCRRPWRFRRSGTNHPESVYLLQEFLTTHRVELIDRCRSNAIKRRAPKATDAELEYGVPLFLEQLVKILKIETAAPPRQSRLTAHEDLGTSAPQAAEMADSASLHGKELFGAGFTVEQVVHGYGDLCQAITGLAIEENLTVPTEEFKTLNRCLDNVMAAAVMEFSAGHDSRVLSAGTNALNERLGFLAHELRNFVHTATLAFAAIKNGNTGLGGATSAVLDRSLIGLSALIDRTLTDVRITAGNPAHLTLVPLAPLIAQVKISAALEASAKGCAFSVTIVDPHLAVHVDHDLLISAIGNLLQNAFKFTHKGSEVCLLARAVTGRILIEISDNCGGLAPGAAEKMFMPFTQLNGDHSGVGLGLSIAQRSVEANHGSLRVRNVPGLGCVFTIDLPQHSMPDFAQSIN